MPLEWLNVTRKNNDLARTLHRKIQFKEWDLQSTAKEYIELPNSSLVEARELIGPAGKWPFPDFREIAGTHAHAVCKGTRCKHNIELISLKGARLIKVGSADFHRWSRCDKGPGSMNFSA